MKTSEMIEGLNILAKHYENPDGYNIGADHDTIYGHATDSALWDEELERMIKLGWHQEFDGKEFTKSDYNPSEGWIAYI